MEDHIGRHARVRSQLPASFTKRVEHRVSRASVSPPRRPLTRRRYGDGQLLLTLEDWLCVRPEAQPPIGVGAKGIASDQRSRDRPHQRQFVGVRDPKDGELVMTEAADLFIVITRQHVREMSNAEPHLGAERG